MRQSPSRSIDGAGAPLTSGNPIDPVGNAPLTSGNPIDPVGNRTGSRLPADAPLTSGKQRAKNAPPRPHVRGANGRRSRAGLKRSRR